jgi:hypothetical protein
MPRAVKIALALAVLACGVFLATRLEFETRKLPVPLSGEAATNPFYAAGRFAGELGAEASWERVFTLPRADAALMLSTWNWGLSRPRRARIERWVEAGGRLIVDGSMLGGHEEFTRWSGIEWIEHDEEAAENDAEVAEPARDVADERGREYFGGSCDRLVEDGTSHTLELCGIHHASSLRTAQPILWALRDTGRIHVLRVAVGRGTVTVINAVPFERRGLFTTDHGTLFARATRIHRGDELLILSEQDQPSLVSLLWRFGAPAVLLGLAALGFALWRTGVRFGPLVAPTDPARRSLAEQIRGTGRFALRFGGGRALHAATARALRDAAIPKLPAYDRMPGEERVRRLAALTGVREDDLGPALNFTGTRSAQELRHAIAILESARRLLKTRSNKHGN